VPSISGGLDGLGVVSIGFQRTEDGNLFCDQRGTTWDDSENDREVAQDDDGFEVLAATERYPDVELTQSDMEGE